MMKDEINAPPPVDKEQLSKDIQIALDDYKQKEEVLEQLLLEIKDKNVVYKRVKQNGSKDETIRAATDLINTENQGVEVEMQLRELK